MNSPLKIKLVGNREINLIVCDRNTAQVVMIFGRHHLSSVKQGGEYFHILGQESLERKSTPEAAQQARGTRERTEFQPPKYSSDAGESKEQINM